MRLGIISDVHCRHAELRRVCELLAARGVDELLLAGDLHYEYRFSDETVDVAREFGARAVSGNHDARVLGGPAASSGKAGRANVELMHALPLELRTRVDGRDLLMVHANPWERDWRYVYEGDERFGRCDELDADYLVLGHTHAPMLRRFGRTMVLNPGSLVFAQGAQRPDALTFGLLDTEAGVGQLLRVDSTGAETVLAAEAL